VLDTQKHCLGTTVRDRRSGSRQTSAVVERSVGTVVDAARRRFYEFFSGVQHNVISLPMG
jgi:hypothetical protein